MKKLIACLLTAALLLSCCSALALDYKATLGNEATMETYTEARQNAPAAMEAATGKAYVPHPAMEDFPGDTAYIYRSPDMYGINAAVRINTTILVYTDKSFEIKDEAKAYLDELGLIDIINEARGSIVLVTPATPISEGSNGALTGGFGAADQKNYYKLQTALFDISGSTGGSPASTYVDASYYGTFGLLYVIGIDGGATFLNNYVATQFDFASRIAGMLLVNGRMDRIRDVSAFVPVYLVNAPESVVAKYEKANGVDTLRQERAKKIEYNQKFPVRKVVTLNTEDVDLKAVISDAYYTLFVKAQRSQEVLQGLYDAGTPYQGGGADTVPYSLSPRNAIFGDRTADGIVLKEVKSEIFSDIKTDAGEYLQTWFEYLPEEALNGKAPDGTIPLILALHGGGDDPRQYVEGQGLLELAGAERVAVVAPDKAQLHANDTEGNDYQGRVLPMLVDYLLETYPALDASRVYVTGYSMGSLSASRAAFNAPEKFAAAFPQAGFKLDGGRGSANPTEAEMAKYEDCDLPIMISTSEYNYQYMPSIFTLYSVLDDLCVMNGLDPLPEEKDYDKYPLSGFEADIYTRELINDDYVVHTWLLSNDDGVPMVGATFVEGINHALYPQYANILWNFFKHYSRNQETGEIEYDPFVR